MDLRITKKSRIFCDNRVYNILIFLNRQLSIMQVKLSQIQEWIVQPQRL